ncbi:MAG: helix-turn-helix transcriptional regulator [Acidobacteria bacterium]|nr:helix-turn-helix transcriptional regulator [Acidobacteriota bacterium]MCY3970274.1 helix-turn-helix transcriptional regulator [Acidobacteriota bacterium]
MSRQDSYDRALAALNDAAFDDACWAEASKRMDEACGATGNIVVIGDEGATGDVEISLARIYFQGEHSTYWEQRYFGRLYQVDERIPRLRRLLPGELVDVRSLYTARERKQSTVYNEMVRAEVQNGLNMRLALPDGAKITWQIANPVGGSDWISDQVRMIQALKPHLLQFTRVRRALVQADALGRSMDAILENKRIGIVQLDRRGRIAAANDTALAHLCCRRVLHDECGFLHATSKTDDKQLQRLVAGALGTSCGGAAGGSMLLQREHATAPFMMHVTPIATSGSDCEPGRIAALALIVDAEQPARVDPGLLTGVLGLTPAEAEVAMLLAAGLTPRQATATCRRGEGTIRWHLHRIFAKLGIERQAQLVQLVRTLGWFPGGKGNG